MPQTKYLLTGAGGFLGKILNLSLSRENQVVTLGRIPSSNYVVDLAAEIPQFGESFDVVVHNAGKAHVVPKTDFEKRAFFDVNVEGTKHLLSALESSPKLPSSVVFISSIGVYGLVRGENIKEDHLLLAKDPYGESKIQAEAILKEWSDKNSVSLTILRLPLIAGMNPPGNLGAMIHGIRKGYYFSIGGGKARKSLVMAEDVAEIIPVAAKTPGTYHLTDGYHPSFHELEFVIASQCAARSPLSIPASAARLMGLMGDVIEQFAPGKSPVTKVTIEKITSTLTFDDEKARRDLGWKPRSVLDSFRIQ